MVISSITGESDQFEGVDICLKLFFDVQLRVVLEAQPRVANPIVGVDPNDTRLAT
jgi:hypothetical protein